MLSAAHTAAPDAAAPPTFKVNADVGSADFSQGVANHVSMMLDNSVNSAKLQVNPPALGPIEVRITVQGDHAQVWMASHSAVTRDALQEATPQLREMLTSQGFAHVSVDISQRSFQERPSTAQAYEWTGERGAKSSAAPISAPTARTRAVNGMLDAYA
jgi:flagellar hook-length control protein FliK